MLSASVMASLFVAASFGADPWVPVLSKATNSLEKLAARLESPDAQVRVSAAVALSEIGTEAAPAVVPLVAALTDEQEMVRYHAAEALQRIGQQAACVAAAEMNRLAEDESTVVARKANEILTEWRIHYGLRRIRTVHESESLIRSSRGDMAHARELLQWKATPLSDLIYESKFLNYLESDNPLTRENAATWIRRLTSDDGELVFLLRDAILKDRMLRALGRPGLRWNPLLSRLSSRYALALQFLPTIYRTADDQERRQIRDLVQEAMDGSFTLKCPAWSDPTEIVRTELLERMVRTHVNSNDSDLRTYARILHEQFQPRPAVKLDPPDSLVKQRARPEGRERRKPKIGDEALARAAEVEAMTEQDPQAIELLQSFVQNDPSQDVRSAAIRTLGRWKEAEAGPILLKVVGNEREKSNLRVDALIAFRRLAAREQWAVDPLLRDVEQQLAKIVAVDEIQKILAGQSGLALQLLKERKAQVLSLIATP